jgi:hypothetical protein
MALGTPALGTAAVVQVGATSNPTTPVGGLVSWTYGADTPTSARNYYGQASVNTVGKTNRTIQFTLDYEVGDLGQLVLAAAVISKATIYARVLPDGTNGEILPVKVTGGSIAGPDVNGFSTVAYTLVQQADPTIVGGGFGT